MVQDQIRILDQHIRDAELSGIALQGHKKERFHEISKELSQLSTSFSHNVLDSTKEYSLVINNKNDMDGLPPSFFALAAQSYNQRKDVGEVSATTENGPWRITLDHPSYIPFLQHCKNRDLREQIYLASIQKASQGKFDNTNNIYKILSLRQEMARLLGFETYAQVSLAKKMAGSIKQVDTLLEELRSASWEPSLKELDEVREFAKSKGVTYDIELWDINYWFERLREHKFQYTEEDLKPYFPLPSVLEGLFKLVNRLFGITVKSHDGEAPIWHPDVRFFRIYNEDNQHIASFYLDPYSRPENKRGGAWMDECVTKGVVDGKEHLPVAYLVCNSTPPVEDRPSLMTFREVETLFHEFGHGLQHMLTTVEYPSVSGIHGVEWDAVELPSQFMENWCYHKPTLLGITKHYETGAQLPDELFEKIHAAKNFCAATFMLRQLRFGMTDMELHHRFDPNGKEDLFDLARRIAKKTSPIPMHDKDRMLCSFSHIFAGGYAAGYYSYKWAEVLSADAFSAFEEAGLDNGDTLKKTGQRFRDTILALGGSRHPMEIFKSFRGREPSTEPLLRHSGLR